MSAARFARLALAAALLCGACGCAAGLRSSAPAHIAGSADGSVAPAAERAGALAASAERAAPHAPSADRLESKTYSPYPKDPPKDDEGGHGMDYLEVAVAVVAAAAVLVVVLAAAGSIH